MKNILSRINLSKLFRWSGWLVAAICLWHMTTTLLGYLNTDPIGYLPSVGQWLIGLFLAVMLLVTGRGLLQLLNLIWLAGLLTLTAVF